MLTAYSAWFLNGSTKHIMRYLTSVDTGTVRMSDVEEQVRHSVPSPV